MTKTPAQPGLLTGVSIPRASAGPREQSVAHIGKASDVGDGALEAGVRQGAVTAQAAVPGVVLAVDATLGHIAVQYFEPLLALAAADDLADPRRQYVHRSDRPAAVIHPHVKGLDGLRVVHHDGRLLCVFLGQIALVLRLQIDAHLTGDS